MLEISYSKVTVAVNRSFHVFGIGLQPACSGGSCRGTSLKRD